MAIKEFDFDFDLGKKYHIQRIKRLRQDISKLLFTLEGQLIETGYNI
jgi:hypothetical protein